MSPEPACLPLQSASPASIMTWMSMIMGWTFAGVAVAGVSASYERLISDSMLWRNTYCSLSCPTGPWRLFWRVVRAVVTSGEPARAASALTSGEAIGDGSAEASVLKASAAMVAIFVKENMAAVELEKGSG
jgi:hypothetical protein